MDILIYTKRENMKELVDEINLLIRFDEGTMISNYECKIKYCNHTIRIKRLNESCRGVKSRVILYDGKFNDEEKYLMNYQLINPFNHDEILLAPYSILKWLIRNDVTYIDMVGYLDNEEIKLVTKNLVKAITFFKNNDGTIYCYEDDKEFGKLWFKECQELWELRDESDSYDSLIRFISELS